MADNFMDFVKDILGIYDDANDFLSKLKQKASTIKVLVLKMQSVGEENKRLLDQAANLRQNPQEVVELMKAVDIDRPILFGKTVMREFSDAQSLYDKLEDKLKRLPREIQQQVKPTLDKVQTDLKQGIKQNAETIRAFTDAQEARKRFYRRVGLTIAGAGAVVVAGAAGFAAGAFAVVNELAAVRSILENPSKFTPGLQSFAYSLDQDLLRMGDMIWAEREKAGKTDHLDRFYGEWWKK